MTNRTDVSVVIPAYNESSTIEGTIARVSDVLAQTEYEFEIVVINDGSDDDTAAILARLAQRRPNVRCAHLSRNFGKEAALSAGLEMARGRAVIVMDADLQHPPELIGQMLEHWRQGYDVINGVKTYRGRESFAHRALSRLFYELIGRSLGRNLKGDSDFKLLDRQVVDALLRCPERHRFFRGLVSWVGFRVVSLPFSVNERAGGTSKWSFWSLLRYSLHCLLVFTSLPLRLIAWLGLIVVLISLLLGIQTLSNYFSGSAVTGFTTVILLLLLLDGLVLISLGVISLYLGRIYDEQKTRPLFLVRRWREGEERGTDDGTKDGLFQDEPRSKQ